MMGSTIGKWDPMMGVMLGSAQGRPGEYLPGGIDPNHYAPANMGPPPGWKPPPSAGVLPQLGRPMPGYAPPAAGYLPGAGAPAGASPPMLARAMGVQQKPTQPL